MRFRVRTVSAGLLLLFAASTHADSGLFGKSSLKDQPSEQEVQEEVGSEPQEAISPPKPKVLSLAGVELGQVVTFRGVGEVFYAGSYDGLDVYFSAIDEPGAYDWKEALNACDRKGEGWLLPTEGELNLIFENKEDLDLNNKGIKASSGNWYWTASDSEEAATIQRFSDGFQQPQKKIYAARVRCVRVY